MNYKNNRRKFIAQGFKWTMGDGALGMFFAVLLFPVTLIRWIIHLMVGRPMPQERYWQLISDQTNGLLELAYEKWGINPANTKVLKPMIFESPCYENIFDEQILLRREKSGLFLSSNYQVTILLPSFDEVYIFQYIFSLFSPEKKEISMSLRYRDIVSIATGEYVAKYNRRNKQYYYTDYKAIIHAEGGLVMNFSYVDTPEINAMLVALKKHIISRKAEGDELKTV